MVSAISVYDISPMYRSSSAVRKSSSSSARHRSRYSRSIFRRYSASGRDSSGLSITDVVERRLGGSRLSRPIERFVPRDLIDPARELRVAAKTAEPPVHLDEDFLHHVLDIGAIAQDPADHREGHRVVPLYDLPKRFLAPPQRLRNEPLVAVTVPLGFHVY